MNADDMIQNVTPLSEMSDRDILEEIAGNMREIRTLVSGTLSEVKPTLDSLMAHPMFRMLTGGKK